MRLNIGCGNFTFPTYPGDPMAREKEAYLPPSAFTAEDWVNVDKLDSERVDQVVDIFKYPWPWKDNSIDEIFCSHVAEHIPHDAIITLPGLDAKLDHSASLDGWYAFFYEVWRVLKPAGLIHIVCPYAFHVGAMADPSHRRYLVPASFGYFQPDADASFDYQIPYRFESTLECGTQCRISDHEWFDKLLAYGVNTLSEIFIIMRAVK